jgi:hypothetical protein
MTVAEHDDSLKNSIRFMEFRFIVVCYEMCEIVFVMSMDDLRIGWLIIVRSKS